LATKEAVEKGLERVKAKFEDRDVKNAFKGFNKSVQFLYPDINVSYVMKISGGEVNEFREGTVNKPDISISMDSDVFLAIQNKEITGAKALGQGKIQVTGIIGDLLLFEKYLI
jgi:putative sterol carrier protein